jgi:hypothetical protein
MDGSRIVMTGQQYYDIDVEITCPGSSRETKSQPAADSRPATAGFTL